MTALADLINDVYTITKRPNLVAETKLAVKAATLKAHQTDYYYKDISETGVAFPTLDYVQQFDLKDVLPRFRTLKYFRRYDSSGTGAAKEFFEVLTPAQTVNSYGNDKTNIVYVAGTTLNVKSYTQLQYALLGVYEYPDITDTGYSSWIADEFPYLIAYDAARVLFKSIGFDEQYVAFEKLVAEQVGLLRLTNVEPVGY
jgi:hypothetical protein